VYLGSLKRGTSGSRGHRFHYKRSAWDHVPRSVAQPLTEHKPIISLLHHYPSSLSALLSIWQVPNEQSSSRFFTNFFLLFLKK
jgi:hypothetical protein